jgi:hypothetical protein
MDASVRWPCAKRIIDLAREDGDLNGMTIQAPYPGDEAGAECIWLSDVDGSLEVPVYKAPGSPVDYDDVFRLPFQVRVAANGKNPDQVMDRLHEIVAALRRIIIENVSLVDLDGVVSATLIDDQWSAGVIKGVGLLAFAEVVVEVHSRISL